jgi:hypothetical protein
MELKDDRELEVTREKLRMLEQHTKHGVTNLQSTRLSATSRRARSNECQPSERGNRTQEIESGGGFGKLVGSRR